MEEKRSCHSMHSVRSQRSFLSRPTSDISYAEDEEKKKIVNNIGGPGNGHYLRHSSNGNNIYAKSVVTDQSSASNYLKVEGGAYRLQRSSSGGSGNSSAHVQTSDSGTGQGKLRTCSDAATQSISSSGTQTDESCLAPLVLHPSSSPMPPPQVYMDTEPMRSGSVAGGPYTRATSPTPPYAYGTNVPTSCYHAYDPNTAFYHTYLNPMVDTGYQYDIVVRRPSVGPSSELTVPGGDSSLRRPSMGTFPMHPGHMMHHHLSPHSLPGSFDSTLPPPMIPSYSNSPVHTGVSPMPPSSPHHFSSTMTSTSPIAINHSDPPHGVSNDTPASSAIPIVNPIPVPATTADIPKLIHETSI